MKEEALYPVIHAFFEKRRYPSWTEPQIRKIRWERVRGAKVIPDIVAIAKGSTIVAVEAEPNASPDSISHGIGQLTRFSAFAGALYLALPAPVPKATRDELRLVCRGIGLIEVDISKHIVRECIAPRTKKPKSSENARGWWSALREVKWREKELAEAQSLRTRKTDMWRRLREGAQYGHSIFGKVSIDQDWHIVRVQINDPPELTSFQPIPVSVEYESEEKLQKFIECCREVREGLGRAGVFDFFGANTEVELLSEIFCIRSDCGHVGSLEFCPECRSHTVEEVGEEDLSEDE
jgi:hypothetical protein